MFSRSCFELCDMSIGLVSRSYGSKVKYGKMVGGVG